MYLQHVVDFSDVLTIKTQCISNQNIPFCVIVSFLDFPQDLRMMIGRNETEVVRGMTGGGRGGIVREIHLRKATPSMCTALVLLRS